MSGRAMGFIGGGVLLVMTLACRLSLPWTLGRSNATSPALGTPSRRYEATDLRIALLPPSWTAHSPDERRRRAAAETESDRPVRVLLGSDRLGRVGLFHSIR